MFKKRLNNHLDFSENEQGTDFFVGDVHGHYDLLMRSLALAGFDKENGDRVFSVGDLINRGNNSIDCINLLTESWFHAVTGNHEDLLLSLKDNPSIINSLINAGGEWLIEYQKNPRDINFIQALIHTKMPVAMTIETPFGRIGLTHAQSPDDWLDITNKDLTDESELFWSLEKYNRPSSLDKAIKNIDVTVHGHTNSQYVVSKKNQLWIDTLRCTGNITVLTAEQVFKYVGVFHDS